MNLFLIRHAQSQNNARPEFQRVEDPGLTELGQRQAVLLGSWVEQLALDRIFVSPFRRTLETALPLYHTTGIAPEVRAVLHEQGGCFSGHVPEQIVGRPGMGSVQINHQFPGYVIGDGVGRDGWWKQVQRETWNEAAERAELLLAQTLEEFASSAERIAYVMHADIKSLFISTFHTELMDMPFNTSVSEISIEADKELKLVRYNLIEHLSEEIVTY